MLILARDNSGENGCVMNVLKNVGEKKWVKRDSWFRKDLFNLFEIWGKYYPKLKMLMLKEKYNNDGDVEETEKLDDNWWAENLDWRCDPCACSSVSL